ncbi:MAG: FAD-dependent oxidoreductase [Candidatus Liptonbacteria bacterium]|nr:FAD-dependent oxidoreductase [Candidatus Liptonbacteria bacterium]
MESEFDVVIVGAGVVGCAIARQLALDYRSRKIAVLEKLAGAGLETSGRNSGVLHSGFHQNPAFLKSKFAREGSELAERYMVERSLAVMGCGMIVSVPCAGMMSGLQEWQNLRHLLRYGRKQKIGFKFLSPFGIQRLEPNIRALAGIFIPSVCVIDSPTFVNSLRRDAEMRGARFFFGEGLKKAGNVGKRYRLETENLEFFAGSVINSAGLYADDVARLAGFVQYKIYPWRGEYYEIIGSKRELVKRLVYPVVPRNSPGKGAHFSPRVGGRLFFGPNARPVPAKDYYEEDKTPVEVFLEEIQKFCPAIKEEDLRWAYSGIRPKIVNTPQESDFIVRADNNHPLWINLIGIESPGLSASMAIGKHVSRIIRLLHL